LLPVMIQNLSDIKPTLEFYMGKNTPERKAFIMDNLINEL
jgi:DNA gyrase subunit B/topoisomerase-4 subunit B